MCDYDAVYYNELLKEGFRDDDIIMDESDDYYDIDMDDWESDDYFWE